MAISRINQIYLYLSFVLISGLFLSFTFAVTDKQERSKSAVKIDLPVIDAVFSSKSATSSFVVNVYDSLKLNFAGLSKNVFDNAVSGMNYMIDQGLIDNQDIITICDFSKSSSEKRLFIIDLKNYKLLFNTYVAHGVNSGTSFAKQFSNKPESNKSSLGFYKTCKTYIGGNGYSLILKGLERGFNDNAESRDIVMHGAEYVSESKIHSQGFLGRSWGCPAVPMKLSRQIIDKIKNGSCLFIYGPDKNYLSHSKVIRNIQTTSWAVNNPVPENLY